MSILVHDQPRSGLFSRIQRLDHFGLFILGFILLYAMLSLALEHGAGIIGFAKTPYLNAGTYLYAIAFAALTLATNRTSFRVVLLHPYAIAVLVVLLISAISGVAKGNPSQYIVGWSLYIFTGVLMFQIFRHAHTRAENADGAVTALYRLPVLGMVLLFTILSVFNKDNHYQYVLFEVIALYAMLIRPSLIEKALGAAIYVSIHLGSNDGFVAVEINRASILAVGMVGLLFLLYRRYLVILFFVIFAAAGGLLYALSLDNQTVDTLPRNIKEAILLMKGDDIYNHVSSYQRIYEGEKVMQDYEGASDAEWLFGMGLGRTVDMTGAADRTVGQHALLGAQEVHNIHFLHYAIFHKFGFAGLALVTILAGSLIWMFAVDLGSGRLDATRMFLYFYLFYGFVFALPASNFLIANPLWPAFLGVLCWLRSRPRSTTEEGWAST